MNITLFGVFGILGFLFWKLLAGKSESDKPERSLRFRIGIYALHLHHWIVAGILLIVCLVLKMYHPVILGFLTGSIIQGLLYRDRFVIFYKSSDYEKIYAKWKK